MEKLASWQNEQIGKNVFFDSPILIRIAEYNGGQNEQNEKRYFTICPFCWQNEMVKLANWQNEMVISKLAE